MLKFDSLGYRGYHYMRIRIVSFHLKTHFGWTVCWFVSMFFVAWYPVFFGIHWVASGVAGWSMGEAYLDDIGTQCDDIAGIYMISCHDIVPWGWRSTGATLFPNGVMVWWYRYIDDMPMWCHAMIFIDILWMSCHDNICDVMPWSYHSAIKS